MSTQVTPLADATSIHAEAYKLSDFELRVNLIKRQLDTGALAGEDVQYFVKLLGGVMLFLRAHGGARIRDNIALVVEDIKVTMDAYCEAGDVTAKVVFSPEALDRMELLLASYYKFPKTKEWKARLVDFFFRIDQANMRQADDTRNADTAYLVKRVRGLTHSRNLTVVTGMALANGALKLPTDL